MLFIGNSAIEESVWVPTSDDPMSNEPPVVDDVDLQTAQTFQSLWIPLQYQIQRTVWKKKQVDIRCFDMQKLYEHMF